MATLKERVGGTVSFSRYYDGALWYKCSADGFEFPVPVPGDVGSATFLPQDKALLFMRYIRKHMDALASARAEQDTAQTQEGHK